MRKLLVLMVASMSMVTFAQQGQPARPAPKEIIFGDGDLIEGKLDRPDVEYFQPGSHPLQPSLIKVREEFKAKVMQSVGEL